MADTPFTEAVPPDHPAWRDDEEAGAFAVLVSTDYSSAVLRAANPDGKAVWVYPITEAALRYVAENFLNIADQIELARRNRKAGLN